ncbi:holo-[acyl-carrier protein] synthase [Panacagrimonas perspica]|uniref:Holo-[acyl-carrier-protein] synthase n=1 Tax=Panacagrimonas perspica TaxID=381431 RepID=A0A4R7NYV9_9GAMM|nr:holo-ACP synthase [Panacagrimonas perspica]TDU25931.1 holo-[acyl-carrier protein] synthase [Panacagrimonas perspica]THD02710.1 holo-[acyl-carrier-protein] synthase [Panacagrimonas perspica]
MIYGIGTDLIRVERIAAVLAKHPDRFAQKLLHPAEFQQYLQSKRAANFLAKSWATKEAFGKALGTGVRGYANPEVGVVRGELGRPHLVYSGAMQARLYALGIVAGHVSLTDEDGLVLAYVVLERDDASP